MSSSSIDFDFTGTPAIQPSDGPEPLNTQPAMHMANGTTASGSAPPVDINSLDQYNDVDPIDEGASIYDRAMPPSDGWHTIKIKPVKDGIAEAKRFQADRFSGSAQIVKFFDRDGKEQTHFMLVVDHQIDEEGKQGNGQSAREWLSTMPQTVNNLTTTSIDTYLEKLTGRSGAGLSRVAKLERLYQVLVTEPQAMAKTQMILQATEASNVKDRKTGQDKLKGDGSTRTEFKIFKYGERSFMKDGKFTFLEEDPETGAAARLKFQIVDLKPLAG